MSTLTTHYSLIKPGVGDPTDEDLWGGELNTDLDSIDTLLWTATNWIKRAVVGVDTATIADRNKIILGDATLGAYAQTLPSCATVGDGFAIALVKTDASANAITVTRAGADTIGGATTFVLSARNQSIVLVSDGVSVWNYFAGSAVSISNLTSGTLAAGVGASATTYDIGTVSSGTTTPAASNGNFQKMVNGGASTLAPPTTITTISLQVTNNGSAGAITTSGFTKVQGSFDTTNAHVFQCTLTKTADASSLIILGMF